MIQAPDWFVGKISQSLITLYEANLRYSPRDPRAHSIAISNALWKARNASWGQSDFPLLTLAMQDLIIGEKEFPTVPVIMDYFRRQQAETREFSDATRKQMPAYSGYNYTSEEKDAIVERFDGSFKDIAKAIINGDNKTALKLLAEEKKP